MSPAAVSIGQKFEALPSERQKVVLDLIDFLETDAWEKIYGGRFVELRQEIQVGLEASTKGDVINGDVMFQALRDRLQRQRAEV